ncbi:AMP-binding protein [soil metagenome]
MSGFRIKIGDEWISESNLATVTHSITDNEYEKKALIFCQSWVNGKQSFEFSTSGSTGVPKKIIFKREQLIASAKMTAKALQLNPGSTSLVCLDTDFIAGAMMLVRGMVVGMNMFVVPPSANPLENIEEHIDFAALVPYQVIDVLERDAKKLNTLGKVIIGGASLTQRTIESLQPLVTAFYATYGMTETITHIALQKLNGIDHQDYFQLLPGVEASLDERGCLVIQAPHLSDDLIITNDIVSLSTKDKFKWIGRYDRVINSGGIKISPEIIEKSIEVIFSTLKIHNRFFIGSTADTKLGHRVVLIIEGMVNEEEKIVTELKDALGKYHVPKKILYVANFIETATQKIDQKATIESLSQ